MEYANMIVYEKSQENAELEGMGTTLVMAILTKDYLLFGNIGDSSGFIVKNKKMHKVTIDHSLVNLLVEAGELTAEQAKDHPRKNVLMKALGASPEIEADIFECSTDIDGVFLASDGLTNMLEISKIEDVINSNDEIEERIVNLIQKANNNGGLDNISVAYLEKDKEVE